MAAIKKGKTPTFTLQVKLVTVLDVECEAATLEDALALGKAWTRKDVVTLDNAASECDSRLTVVGCWGSNAWSVD